MNIEDLVRDARPRTTKGWSDSDAGRRVLAAVLASPRSAEPVLASPGSAAPVRRGPSRRLVLAGALPVVAAAATGAVFLAHRPADAPAITADPPPGSGPASPGPASPAPAQTARQILLAAAVQAADEPETDGRFWVRGRESGNPYVVGPAGHRYTIIGRHAIEEWIPTDPAVHRIIYSQLNSGAAPATPKDEAAWRADGSPTVWHLPGGEVLSTTPGPWERMVDQPPKGVPGPMLPFYLAGQGATFADVAALPADPAALKRRLQTLLGGGVQLSTSGSYFEAVEDLLFNLPVRPGVRAAAYRLLAEADGAIAYGPVIDQAGRAGVAVGFDRRDDGGKWYQIRLVIEPGTGRPLSTETWSLDGHRRPVTRTDFNLVMRNAYTDDTPPPTHP